MQIKSYGISFIHLFSLNLAKIGHFYAFLANSPEKREYLGISKTHFLNLGAEFLTFNFYPLPLKFGTFLHNYKTYDAIEPFFLKYIFLILFFFEFFFRVIFSKKIKKLTKTVIKRVKKALIEKIPHYVVDTTSMNVVLNF